MNSLNANVPKKCELAGKLSPLPHVAHCSAAHGRIPVCCVHVQKSPFSLFLASRSASHGGRARVMLRSIQQRRPEGSLQGCCIQVRGSRYTVYTTMRAAPTCVLETASQAQTVAEIGRKGRR